mmetsp:Transcript_23744/g.43482  ORF Transcript_23744/g.43482 Transcript_23744/m.43482 type:complete len:504 (-) Transcript_23744:66-1577(-)
MAGEPIAGRGARFSGKGSFPGMAHPYGGQSMWDMGPTGPSAGSSPAAMGGYGSGMYSDGRGGHQSMWDMGANGAQTAPSHGSGRSMWDQGPREHSGGERSRSMWDQGPQDGGAAAARPAAQTVPAPVRVPPASAPPAATSMPANSKRGTVKSYSVVNGFGFIVCREIPQDIYFGRDSLQADLRTSDVAGTEVLFELIRAPDGKPQARSLKPIGPVPKPSGVQLPPGSAPAAASQAPMAQPQAQPQQAQPQPQQAHPGAAGAGGGCYGGGGPGLGGMMPGSGYFPGKGAPMMARPGYPTMGGMGGMGGMDAWGGGMDAWGPCKGGWKGAASGPYGKGGGQVGWQGGYSMSSYSPPLAPDSMPEVTWLEVDATSKLVQAGYPSKGCAIEHSKLDVFSESHYWCQEFFSEMLKEACNFEHDSEATLHPEVYQAWKAAGKADNMQLVVTCPKFGVWAVGFGGKKNAERAAKLALATVLAQVVDPSQTAAVIGNYPAFGQYLEKINTT